MANKIDYELEELLAIDTNEGEYQFRQRMKYFSKEIRTVSSNPRYWAEDVDFIVDGIKYEVKWDSRIAQTGNLFYEFLLWNNHTSKYEKGCMTYTKADYLAYGDAINNRFYLIPMRELRKWVNRHKDRLNVGTCYNDKKREAKGYLVPLSKIMYMVEEI